MAILLVGQIHELAILLVGHIMSWLYYWLVILLVGHIHVLVTLLVGNIHELAILLVGHVISWAYS